MDLTENPRTRHGSDASISRKPRPKSYLALSSLLLLMGPSFLKDGQHAVLKLEIEPIKGIGSFFFFFKLVDLPPAGS